MKGVIIIYKLAENVGDGVMVPRVVFSKLKGSKDDGRFRVALHVLEADSIDPAHAARELCISKVEVERALEFWEGAGLVVNEQPAVPAGKLSEIRIEPRRRLTSKEVAVAAAENKDLGAMVQELQRIFGGVVSQADINIFITLCESDGFAPDLVLLSAMHCAADGKANARYIEKVLFSWRNEGIDDCVKADAFLCQLAKRSENESLVAAWMEVPVDSFTLGERKKAAQIVEEFGYGQEMFEAARMVAGENRGEVRYIAAILKKWHSKGYKNAKEVRAENSARNIPVHASHATVAPGNDLLKKASAYVPLSKRRRNV